MSRSNKWSVLLVNVRALREAGRARSAVTLLFVINLVLAALAALPILRGMFRFTGHSLMSQTIGRAFSVEWLTDFIMNSPGSMERYASVITLVGMISIPLNAVLSGGVLGGFRNGSLSFSRFFHDAARYSWPMIRLSIVGLVGYWIVFRLLLQQLGGLVRSWAIEAADSRPVFWAHLGWALLVIVGLAFLNIVMDYARVSLVLVDDAGVWRALGSSLRFVRANSRAALLAWAPLSLCSALLAAFYVAMAPWREPGGLAFAALLFVVQQVLMFSRYWFRVAAWASEWICYSASATALRESES